MKTFSGYVELMIERLVRDQLLVVLSKEEGFEKIPNLPWCFGPMLKTLRLILAASKSDGPILNKCAVGLVYVFHRENG